MRGVCFEMAESGLQQLCDLDCHVLGLTRKIKHGCWIHSERRLTPIKSVISAASFLQQACAFDKRMLDDVRHVTRYVT